MIEVSKEQQNQVEYLLHQSAQGNHLLFEPETLRRVFHKDSGRPDESLLNPEEAYAVEHHIERLVRQPGIVEMRAYLDALDSRTFEWVVRTYFSIVENSIFENLEACH